MIHRASGLRDSVLSAAESEVLGDGRDAMTEVERRVSVAFAGQRVIAWEGSAQTFQFTYVSPAASILLGYPAGRWTEEPTFWADHVVANEDRGEAIAYCALATANKRDHVFEYRARAADGRLLVLRDVVRVILGPRGIPERLRGLMFDVTRERPIELSPDDLRARQSPAREELAEPLEGRSSNRAD